MTVLAWCLLAVAALVILSGLGRGSRRHPGHLPGDFDFDGYKNREIVQRGVFDKTKWM
ncbi:MAG TPA: hypothetical protein PKC79_04740 [Solidesulfovibrio magneticus]|nr:hypothetical protein [Solidesulfovibrio magneticus]